MKVILHLESSEKTDALLTFLRSLDFVAVETVLDDTDYLSADATNLQQLNQAIANVKERKNLIEVDVEELRKQL
jgi:hypothetical protein